MNQTTPASNSERSGQLISLVLPSFNEEAGLELFHHRLLRPAINEIHDFAFEIIYVDDGSTDSTRDSLKRIAESDPSVRVVSLSRNFGKEIAITAGISFAEGDAIVILDSDGQHPPQMISEFITRWAAGAQVVVGVRQSNQEEGFVKRTGSRLFYRTLNAISEMQTVPRSTDFRLIDKDVREEFLKLSEPNRISRGLIDWLGFERSYVEFDSPARIAGSASYSVRSLFRLAINSFTTMSLRPLFAFGYLGMAITILALLLGVFLGIEQFILGDPMRLNVTGSALLGVFVAFLVGLVLTAQGVMALYVSHIHSQTQQRPLFVVNKGNSCRL